MPSPSPDSVIRTYREQISEIDLEIVKALNGRIKLVKNLKAFKEAQGLSFFDAAQEARVIAILMEANRGPVSNEGLRELYGFILEWTKREVARLGKGEAE